jgi:hypothetical protein
MVPDPTSRGADRYTCAGPPLGASPLGASTSEEGPKTPPSARSDATDTLQGVIRGHVFLEAAPTPAPGARVAAVLDGTHEPPAWLPRTPSAPMRSLSSAPADTPCAPGATAGPWHLAVRRRDCGRRLPRAAEGVDRVLIPGGCVTGRVVRSRRARPSRALRSPWNRRVQQDGSQRARFASKVFASGSGSSSARAAGFVGSRAQVDVLEAIPHLSSSNWNPVALSRARYPSGRRRAPEPE